MNFVREHEGRLIKRAPCFFNLCVPCITEEYKISVFFHTSKSKKQDFGVSLLIIAEEADSPLMDSFEKCFDQMMENFTMLNSIELFKVFEEEMFTQDCKSH